MFFNAQADLRERCFTPSWWALALYAGIMATVYTAGLPLLLTLWLRQYRKELDSPRALANVGFLYETCVAPRLPLPLSMG